MTDKKPYTYTVLRYVHDVNTGEFVNVGVVVHAPDARFVGAKLRHTHGRLSAMFPDLDRDAFRSSMRVIERALKSVAVDYAKGDLFRFESDAAGIARSVLPADDSALQWSPVGSGLASNFEQLLDRLFERLVAGFDDKPERNKRSDDDVWRPVRDKLDVAKIGVTLSETVIRGEVDELQFKHAWKNGVWHCYEAVSFDLADADGIKNKARRWMGHLASVRDVAGQFKPYFIVGAPHDQALMPAFEDALAILRKSPVPTEVFNESEADELVARIEAEVQAHG
jgi:Protein of unknown function (DUF3037)